MLPGRAAGCAGTVSRQSGTADLTPTSVAMVVLAALTGTLVVAMPSMCLPVLFDEIAADLDLSLVQIGAVWGVVYLPGAFVGLIGGPLGDRFGAKPTLAAACLLTGLTGAARGMVPGFGPLAAATVFFGASAWIVPMNVNKLCMQWVPRSRLGLANGVVCMGMALGFMAGAVVSGSVLVPWLGDWRRVLFFYGAVAVVLGAVWYAMPPPPDTDAGTTSSTTRSPIGRSLMRIARIRTIWLLGGTLFGVSGCVNGMLGYLPLYLTRVGWPETLADTALGSFHGMSMLAVIPIALVSDRFASRHGCLMAAVLFIAVGTGLLAVVEGAVVWAAILMAGMVRDGFMAVLFTIAMENRRVGTRYAGTALGFVMMFSSLGALIAPPLGNGLASVAPALPFALWSAFALTGFGCALGVREEK